MSFLSWKPAITPEDIFADKITFGEITAKGESVYWLESRPTEKGRNVIMRKQGNSIEELTPKGMNVRNRVHEYGGGSYCIGEGIYFVNFEDERIYFQSSKGRVMAITPEKNADGSLGKYASLTLNPGGTQLVFIYEKEFKDKENKNYLAMLTEPGTEPKILAEGSDFYADPVFSPDGKRLAWLQWNHPHMPWESTELMIAEFSGDKLGTIAKVAGGKDSSICSPCFDSKGNLYFVMDDTKQDFWNLYCYEGKVQQITNEPREMGTPHWVFGSSTLAILPDDRLVAAAVKQGMPGLIVIDPQKKSVTDVPIEMFPYRTNICTDAEGSIVFAGGGIGKGSGLFSVHPTKGPTILRKGSSLSITSKDISLPEHITYPTTDKKKAHAFYYAPENSKYTLPKEKPPLVVLAHGGPTSATTPMFSPVITYFTSSGFAVLDCNYRGSSGYGRKYRDALYGKWGVMDITDVADGVKHLVKEGKADSKRIAIRGGSAGGYVVQRALTMFPELFTTGASYFGIGNLKTLVEQTHKFEAKYTEQLIGPPMAKDPKLYEDRSPINHLDKLKAPMIIFQGGKDKIVTPDCSREMADILKKKGIKHQYVEYPEEGHGFRAKENNIDSLKKEMRFYRQVFSS